MLTPLLERAQAGGVEILGSQPEDEAPWDDDGCADHARGAAAVGRAAGRDDR